MFTEPVKMTQKTFDLSPNEVKPGPPFKKERKISCSALKITNRFLVRCFRSLGYQVGVYPVFFIIVPVLVTIALSTGLFFIKYEENPLVLFVPFTAPFLREQKIVEEHFPMNYSTAYSPVRFTRHEGHSRVIVSAKDRGSILRSILWPEIVKLDESIRNITVKDTEGNDLYYEELCNKWEGKCGRNLALNLNEIINELEDGVLKINYPIMIYPLMLPQLLGSPIINDSYSVIEDAEAIMLAYFVAADSEVKVKRAYEWEEKMINLLHASKFDHIRISYYTSRSLSDELKIKMDSSIPYMPLTGFIMVTACMILLWRSDCIRGKPLVGIIGIISSVMATGASFGFLVYCGSIYTRLNVVAFFLVLGIGVDDIFVALSSWQKTSPQDSVPKRLASTYADAAVSVTITSLTNALAFAVGTSTPALIVQTFCLYSCLAIVFAYLFFITFCGGFIAVSGYMEEQGRHSLFLFKLREVPEKAPSIIKRFCSLFCASSSRGINAVKEEEVHTHVISSFFRDYVGTLLCNSVFRVCVLLSLFVYWGGAIYGLTVLREGLFRHRMSRDDSYLVDFSHDDDRYFRHMPYSIQVLVTNNLTYSDPETQQKLLQLQEKFASLPYGSDPIFNQFWLTTFLKRLRRSKGLRERITDEASFIKILRKTLFVDPDDHRKLDVQFDANYTRIIASRMIFQVSNVSDVYDDVVMMHTYRKVAAESEFNVTCFHLLFSLFDQHAMLRPIAIQSIMMAVVVVIVVALFFIPDVRGSIAIAFSILSIAIGVVGFMAYWNINLDQVSVGSIFMCIGFSVDFSAHITYTYLSSKYHTSEDKIRDSMQSLGLPILQGGFTTILSLFTFLLIPGYGYRTFFKTIFLVTIFAAYHSIILIPLFLAKLEDLCAFMENKVSKSKEEIVTNDSNIKTNGFVRKLSNGRTTNGDIAVIVESNKENGVSSIQPVVNGNAKIERNGVDKNILKSNGSIKIQNENNIKSSTTNGGIDNKAYVNKNSN